MSEDITWIAIHRRVLVVATFREEGTWKTWKAYVVPVAGMNHNLEAEGWREDGAALCESHARAFFGYLEDTRYAS